MKVSISVKNQPQLPVTVEKSDIDSSMEYEKQMSYDSAVGHDTKMNVKVTGPDSGFPAPAAPNNLAASTSDSVCEPNIPLASEVGNNEKEPSASLSCPLSAGKSKNVDVQNGLQGPHLEDKSLMEAVRGNTCAIEAPCLKSISDSSVETVVSAEASGKENHFTLDNAESTIFIGNIGSPVKVSEDADPQETVNNCSVLEASSLSATGGEDVASFATKHELHSSMEALANSAATSDLKISAVESSILDDEDGCDAKVLCTKRSPEASPEVSSEDVPEKVNEYQNCTPTSTLTDLGNTTAPRNAEIECKDNIQVQNDLVASATSPEEAANSGGADKPDGETETALVVDGEVASISPSEYLSQTMAPTESIKESSVASGENSR